MDVLLYHLLGTVYGCLSCHSLWAGGWKAVGGGEDPLLRYDWGPTHMPIGLEVKADLPGPFPHGSVLPSHDAVQLIRSGATRWHLTEDIMREEEHWRVRAKYLERMACIIKKKRLLEAIMMLALTVIWLSGILIRHTGILVDEKTDTPWGLNRGKSKKLQSWQELLSKTNEINKVVKNWGSFQTAQRAAQPSSAII